MKTLPKINNMEEYDNVIENNDKVIIYWNTKWCPDCFVSRRFMPIIVNDFEDFEFYQIEKNQNLELAAHLNIYGVPSFLVFVKGVEVGRLVNKRRKSYNEVKEFIQNTISK